MLATCLICYLGTKGIEKASSFMMPVLFLILLVIIVRSVTLPNAGLGLSFIFAEHGEPVQPQFAFRGLWDRCLLR